MENTKLERINELAKLAKERELTILKELYGEKDSTYIKELAFSAKLYYKRTQGHLFSALGHPSPLRLAAPAWHHQPA